MDAHELVRPLAGSDWWNVRSSRDLAAPTTLALTGPWTATATAPLPAGAAAG